MEPDKKKIATSVLPIIILLNYVFLYFKKEPIMSFQEVLSGIKSPRCLPHHNLAAQDALDI